MRNQEHGRYGLGRVDSKGPLLKRVLLNKTIIASNEKFQYPEEAGRIGDSRQSGSTTLSTYVIFRVGLSQYGIGLGNAGEVLRAASIVPLPSAPRIIEGIVDIRGKVVPVLDIRSRFRLAPQPLHPSDQFVIATACGRTVALRVNQVMGLAEIADGDIDNAKALVPRSEYVAGVARLPDGLVLLHDLDAFLSEAESEEMDAAVERVSA